MDADHIALARELLALPAVERVEFRKAIDGGHTLLVHLASQDWEARDDVLYYLRTWASGYQPVRVNNAEWLVLNPERWHVLADVTVYFVTRELLDFMVARIEP